MLIPESEQREVLVYAFRYCLGRSTYCTATLSDLLIKSWPLLSEGDKELYKREIRQAIEGECYGMEMDKKAWERILEL